MLINKRPLYFLIKVMKVRNSGPNRPFTKQQQHTNLFTQCLWCSTVHIHMFTVMFCVWAGYSHFARFLHVYINICPELSYIYSSRSTWLKSTVLHISRNWLYLRTCISLDNWSTIQTRAKWSYYLVQRGLYLRNKTKCNILNIVPTGKLF